MSDLNSRGDQVKAGRSVILISAHVTAKLIWLVGIISTLVVVYMSLGAPIYALFFKNYATPGFDWQKVATIALTTMPLCGFAAIGFMGLRFWPRGPFRLIGLAAILFQTAMALLAYASPFGFLDVTSGWMP